MYAALFYFTILILVYEGEHFSLLKPSFYSYKFNEKTQIRTIQIIGFTWGDATQNNKNVQINRCIFELFFKQKHFEN